MGLSAVTPGFPKVVEQFAGQSVVELAKRYGTPLFAYDAAVIAERIADLAAFDVVRYAQKACSNLAVLDLVRRHGAVVDAVSAGEIRRALAAGSPSRVAAMPGAALSRLAGPSPGRAGWRCGPGSSTRGR